MRFRLDRAKDRLVIEVEEGTVADTIKGGHPKEDPPRIEVDVDAAGYVLQVRIAPLSDMLGGPGKAKKP